MGTAGDTGMVMSQHRCFYWLQDSEKEQLPFEVLEEDLEVKALLGVDEGHLWTELNMWM